jgi:hypothetical protein
LRNLHQILTNHLSRYPGMEAQDIYKLLLQAALGSEHAVRNEESAREWLERELASMGNEPDEPLFDPISPGGEIGRVHLRPYLAAGKDTETLLRAFVRTANEWRGSKETLKEYGAAAARLADVEKWTVRPEEIESFFTRMESQDFPAAHHSEIYGRLYRPAYRVIARRLLEEI